MYGDVSRAEVLGPSARPPGGAPRPRWLGWLHEELPGFATPPRGGCALARSCDSMTSVRSARRSRTLSPCEAQMANGRPLERGTGRRAAKGLRVRRGGAGAGRAGERRTTRGRVEDLGVAGEGLVARHCQAEAVGVRAQDRRGVGARSNSCQRAATPSKGTPAARRGRKARGLQESAQLPRPDAPPGQFRAEGPSTSARLTHRTTSVPGGH